MNFRGKADKRSNCDLTLIGARTPHNPLKPPYLWKTGELAVSAPVRIKH